MSEISAVWRLRLLPFGPRLTRRTGRKKPTPPPHSQSNPMGIFSLSLFGNDAAVELTMDLLTICSPIFIPRKMFSVATIKRNPRGVEPGGFEFCTTKLPTKKESKEKFGLANLHHALLNLTPENIENHLHALINRCNETIWLLEQHGRHMECVGNSYAVLANLVVHSGALIPITLQQSLLAAAEGEHQRVSMLLTGKRCSSGSTTRDQVRGIDQDNMGENECRKEAGGFRLEDYTALQSRRRLAELISFHDYTSIQLTPLSLEIEIGTKVELMNLETEGYNGRQKGIVKNVRVCLRQGQLAHGIFIPPADNSMSAEEIEKWEVKEGTKTVGEFSVFLESNIKIVKSGAEESNNDHGVQEEDDTSSPPSSPTAPAHAKTADDSDNTDDYETIVCSGNRFFINYGLGPVQLWATEFQAHKEFGAGLENGKNVNTAPVSPVHFGDGILTRKIGLRLEGYPKVDESPESFHTGLDLLKRLSINNLFRTGELKSMLVSSDIDYFCTPPDLVIMEAARDLQQQKAQAALINADPDEKFVSSRTNMTVEQFATLGCDACAKKASDVVDLTKLLVCSRCKTARYCTKTCRNHLLCTVIVILIFGVCSLIFFSLSLILFFQVKHNIGKNTKTNVKHLQSAERIKKKCLIKKLQKR